jgi:hypothetical protein
VSVQSFVDATDGLLLDRTNLIDYDSDDPTWNAFRAYPNLDYASTDTRQTWCWTPATGCDLAVQNASSPLPWDLNPATGLSTNTTSGNNDVATEDRNSNAGGHQGTNTSTPSPTRDDTYAWTNQWQTSGCDPNAFTSPTRNDIDAADANLFAMHNRMHDFAYKLGFTESAFNAQVRDSATAEPGVTPNMERRRRAGSSAVRRHSSPATTRTRTRRRDGVVRRDNHRHGNRSRQPDRRHRRHPVDRDGYPGRPGSNGPLRHESAGAAGGTRAGERSCRARPKPVLGAAPVRGADVSREGRRGLLAGLAVHDDLHTSPSNAFPSVRPRPRAPELIIRSFDVPMTQASHIRLVVLSTQCTGFAGYAGEQDSDPRANTDCATAGSAAASQTAYVAEFQVFSG